MAVREFTSGDDLARAIGALSGMTYGTFVFYVKLADISGTSVFAQLHTSGGSFSSRLGVGIVDDDPFWGNGGSGPDFIEFADEAIWICYVFRKVSGTIEPEASLYDSNTDTWFHETGNNTIANATSPGAGGTVRFTAGGSFSFEGRIAAKAIWANSNPWSTTTDIENAGLEDAYQNWMDNNPSAAWRFNQDNVGDSVVDDTGNGADQTSISGTTVITGDDPPGFDFSFSNEQELNVPFFENVNSIFPISVENQSDLELNVPHLFSEAQLFVPTVVNQDDLELNVPHHSSESQVFAPTVVSGDKQLDIPHHASESQLFTPSLDIQVALELDIPHHSSEAQLFTVTVNVQNDLELDLSRLESTSQIFVPQVINEGDDVFEPTLVGNGSFADQMMAGLIDQGFLTGSLADRERARLLAKLSLSEPQGFSIADLYRQADEVNRLAGVLEPV